MLWGWSRVRVKGPGVPMLREIFREGSVAIFDNCDDSRVDIARFKGFLRMVLPLWEQDINYTYGSRVWMMGDFISNLYRMEFEGSENFITHMKERFSHLYGYDGKREWESCCNNNSKNLNSTRRTNYLTIITNVIYLRRVSSIN